MFECKSEAESPMLGLGHFYDKAELLANGNFPILISQFGDHKLDLKSMKDRWRQATWKMAPAFAAYNKCDNEAVFGTK